MLFLPAGDEAGQERRWLQGGSVPALGQNPKRRPVSTTAVSQRKARVAVHLSLSPSMPTTSLRHQTSLQLNIASYCYRRSTHSLLANMNSMYIHVKSIDEYH